MDVSNPGAGSSGNTSIAHVHQERLAEIDRWLPGGKTYLLTHDRDIRASGLAGNPAILRCPKLQGNPIQDFVRRAKHAIEPDTHARGSTMLWVSSNTPFLRREHIRDALAEYSAMRPSFLMTMNSAGLDAEMFYLFDLSRDKDVEDPFGDRHNAFVHMVEDSAAFKAAGPAQYFKAAADGERTVPYSSGKQRELAARYRDNMRDYDTEFMDKKEITDPVVWRSSRDALERIARLVSLKRGRRTLDLGCSSGNLTIRYARAARTQDCIIGVDIDRKLIRAANQYLSKEPASVRRKLHFVLSPIEKLEEKPESFDTITATEIFEHILHTQHDSLLTRAVNLLKPRGNMIVSVPNRFPSTLYDLQKRYRWDWSNHYTHFTPKSLEYLMARYFARVNFHTVYPEPPQEGIFLIAEGIGKK